jgi:hypothetical protein
MKAAPAHGPGHPADNVEPSTPVGQRRRQAMHPTAEPKLEVLPKGTKSGGRNR